MPTTSLSPRPETLMIILSLFNCGHVWPLLQSRVSFQWLERIPSVFMRKKKSFYCFIVYQHTYSTRPESLKKACWTSPWVVQTSRNRAGATFTMFCQKDSMVFYHRQLLPSPLWSLVAACSNRYQAMMALLPQSNRLPLLRHIQKGTDGIKTTDTGNHIVWQTTFFSKFGVWALRWSLFGIHAQWLVGLYWS